jgi:hypothetical protein
LAEPSALAAWYFVLHSFIVNACAGDDMIKAATSEPAAEKSSLCVVLYDLVDATKPMTLSLVHLQRER